MMQQTNIAKAVSLGIASLSLANFAFAQIDSPPNDTSPPIANSHRRASITPLTPLLQGAVKRASHYSDEHIRLLETTTLPSGWDKRTDWGWLKEPYTIAEQRLAEYRKIGIPPSGADAEKHAESLLSAVREFYELPPQAMRITAVAQGPKLNTEYGPSRWDEEHIIADFLMETKLHFFRINLYLELVEGSIAENKGEYYRPKHSLDELPDKLQSRVFDTALPVSDNLSQSIKAMANIKEARSILEQRNFTVVDLRALNEASVRYLDSCREANKSSADVFFTFFKSDLKEIKQNMEERYLAALATEQAKSQQEKQEQDSQRNKTIALWGTVIGLIYIAMKFFQGGGASTRDANPFFSMGSPSPINSPEHDRAFTGSSADHPENKNPGT